MPTTCMIRPLSLSDVKTPRTTSKGGGQPSLALILLVSSGSAHTYSRHTTIISQVPALSYQCLKMFRVIQSKTPRRYSSLQQRWPCATFASLAAKTSGPTRCRDVKHSTTRRSAYSLELIASRALSNSLSLLSPHSLEHM